LAYLVAALDLNAGAILISGAATIAGDPIARLLHDLGSGAASIAAASSVFGDIQSTAAATLDVSASALSVSATGLLVGDLQYLVPTLDLSASHIFVGGLLAFSGDPRARFVHEIGTAVAALSAELAVSGAVSSTTFAPVGRLNVRLIGSGGMNRQLVRTL
jgi:hypothetical protein